MAVISQEKKAAPGRRCICTLGFHAAMLTKLAVERL
jgi:hypothetical protein